MQTAKLLNACLNVIILLSMANIFVCVPALSQSEQKGQNLFQKLHCVECHSVAGSGGCLGPALDGVMSRRDKAYVRMRLNENDEAAFVKLIGHPELLPHPRFKSADVADLMVYLNTLSDRKVEAVNHHAVLNQPPAPQEKPSQNSSTELDIAGGKKLFYDSGCLSCHTVGGIGGQIGPNLDSVGAHLQRLQIELFIAYPVSKKMPRIALTAVERRKIVDFLMSLNEQSKH